MADEDGALETARRLLREPESQQAARTSYIARVRALPTGAERVHTILGR